MEALARPGDVAIGISTSGESETCGWGFWRRDDWVQAPSGSWDAPAVASVCDLALVVPADETPRISGDAHSHRSHHLREGGSWSSPPHDRATRHARRAPHRRSHGSAGPSAGSGCRTAVPALSPDPRVVARSPRFVYGQARRESHVSTFRHGQNSIPERFKVWRRPALYDHAQQRAAGTMNINGRSVLVTGGCGFIGSATY